MEILYESEILEKIHRKGWEIYDSTLVSNEAQADESIKIGPASKLEVGKRYVMLPKIDDCKNPRAVFDALEKVALRTNRESPTILINGQRFPWTGFKPLSTDIKVNTSKGHRLNNQDFIKALDSIFQI